MLFRVSNACPYHLLSSRTRRVLNNASPLLQRGGIVQHQDSLTQNATECTQGYSGRVAATLLESIALHLPSAR